jgi:hypothetical protein
MCVQDRWGKVEYYEVAESVIQGTSEIKVGTATAPELKVNVMATRSGQLC